MTKKTLIDETEGTEANKFLTVEVGPDGEVVSIEELDDPDRLATSVRALVEQARRGAAERVTSDLEVGDRLAPNTEAAGSGAVTTIVEEYYLAVTGGLREPASHLDDGDVDRLRRGLGDSDAVIQAAVESPELGRAVAERIWGPDRVEAALLNRAPPEQPAPKEDRIQDPQPTTGRPRRSDAGGGPGPSREGREPDSDGQGTASPVRSSGGRGPPRQTEGTGEPGRRRMPSSGGGGTGVRGPGSQVAAGEDPGWSREGSDGTGANGTGSDSKTGGDPVELASGQFRHQVTDLEVAGRGLHFAFTRTYRNRTEYKGPLGYNWDHSYNLWLREEQETQPDGTLRNVVYRSTGTLREDRYVQDVEHPAGDPPPLSDRADATFESPPGFFDRLEKRGGEYVLETASGVRYHYNEALDIDRIVDPNGNELTFEYDDRNRLRRVVDPVGKAFEFEYDELGRIEWLVDVEGERCVNYYYGDNGDLEEVDQHLGDHGVTGTDYRYSGPDRPIDRQHNLLQVIDANGETVVENEYGSLASEFDVDAGYSYNRVVRQRSAEGEFRYRYGPVTESHVDPVDDPENVPVTETCVAYPDGHEVVHWSNAQGNVVRRRERIPGADGTGETLEATYRYDEDGLLVEQTLADGSTTEYEYERERYAETHGGTVEGASPADRLAFGNLLRTVRHPRPGRGESRRIVTEFTYDDGTAPGAPRVATVRGPYYATPHGAELPDQPVRSVTFEHDDRGNLVSVSPDDVEQPDGTSVTPAGARYEYDEHGSVTDAHVGGVHRQYEYFDDELRSGFVREATVDPGGLALGTEYDVDILGRTTSETDPYGATVGVEWTPFDTPARVTLPAPADADDRPTIEYEYDRTLQLVRSEEELLSPDGTPHPDEALVRTRSYDAYGRLVERTRGPAADPEAHVRTVAYNRSGRRARVTDWRGTVARTEYTDRGFPERITRAWGRPEETTRERTYDRAGAIVERTDGRGSTTRYDYDAFGRLEVVQTPDGNRLRAEYDAAGRVTRLRLFGPPPDGGDAIRWSERRVDYDPLGRAIQVHDHAFDPEADAGERVLTTRFVYDENGRLQRVQDPTDAARTFEYDAVGRRVTARDPDGNEVRYDYDDDARRLDVVETLTGVDADGDEHTHVRRETVRFGPRGLAREVVDAAGNVVQRFYDSRGDLARVVGPEGNERHVDRDAFGRPVARHEGRPTEDVTTRYEYDENGNLVELVDPVGNAAEFDYDALDRRVGTTRGDRERTRTYDGEGLPVEIVDENGVVVTREYTPGGRLRHETADASGFAPPPERPGYAPAETGEVRFRYTPAGRIARASNAETTVTRRYDSLGRLLEDDVDGRATSMTYDDAGRLRTLDYPDGRLVRYDYSEGGVLESVAQRDAGSHYPGDPSRPDVRSLLTARRIGDRPTRLAYGQASVRFQYDPRRLPVGADWRSADGDDVLEERRLFGPRRQCRVEQFDDRLRTATFDALTRQTGVEDRDDAPTIDVSGLSPPTDLTDVDRDGQARADALLPGDVGTVVRTISYGLDDNANRERVTEDTGDAPAEAVRYDVGAFDRYDSVDGASFVYDDVGNLLEGGSRQFRYDTDHRLVAVEHDGDRTELSRDALGRVVRRERNGTETSFTYTGRRLVEWKTDGGPAPDDHGRHTDGQLVHADGRYCHLATDGREFVPLQDLAGTVTGWLSADGDLAGSRTYGPFGRVRSQDGEWPAPVGFRGYLEHRQTGLCLLAARTYDPEIGRFLQPDPAGYADGPNRYTYANHAPLYATDRWGYAEQTVDWGQPTDEALDEIGRPDGAATELGQVPSPVDRAVGRPPERGSRPPPDAGGAGEPSTAGGSPDGSPRGIPGSAGADPAGGAYATPLDAWVAVAGITQFEPGSEEGKSGGVPVGSNPDALGSPFFQYLYIFGAVVSSVGSAFGGVARSGVRRVAREVPGGTGLNDRLIHPMELVTVRGTAGHGASRGVTRGMRRRVRKIARDRDYEGPVDAAHLSPHVFTPPGERIRMRPQARSVNRAEGADIKRAAEARRRWNERNPDNPLPVRERPLLERVLRRRNR